MADGPRGHVGVGVFEWPAVRKHKLGIRRAHASFGPWKSVRRAGRFYITCCM